MKTKRQKGFTMAELMLGIAAGSIVLLTSGTAVVTNQKFWNNALEKVNLQQDASYAMQGISRTIRAAKSAKLEYIENYGEAITIQRDSDWIRYFHSPATNELKFMIEGGQPQNLLNDNVESLYFTVAANRINIDLRLRKGHLEDHFVSTVTIRNYGE